jgi:hypothetical protein
MTKNSGRSRAFRCARALSPVSGGQGRIRNREKYPAAPFRPPRLSPVAQAQPVLVSGIPAEILPQLRRLPDVELQVESLPHLHLPLDAKRRLAYYQRPPERVRMPCQHLTQNEASLNGFAQTDLVRQKQPLFGGTQELQERLKLVSLEFRAAGAQRVQRVLERLAKAFVSQQARKSSVIAELSIQQSLLDRHFEGDSLEITFGHLNRVGTAGENYPVKVPAGEPEGWSLDSPALIAAVPPYHQVAVLKYRRHATPDLLAVRGTCPGRTKDGGCSVEFTRPPSSHIGEIVALTAVPRPGDQPSSQVEV